MTVVSICNVTPVCYTIIQTQVIPSFKKQHPDIQLNVSTNSREQIQESLLNASADYGVYFSCEEEHPILDSRILDEDELVYCSKHDLLSDPLEHTKIMTVPKGNPLYAEQKRLFQQLYLTFPATSCEAAPSISFFLEKMELETPYCLLKQWQITRMTAIFLHRPRDIFSSWPIIHPHHASGDQGFRNSAL